MERVVVVRERVRYAETDRMGVAYHAHYLVWFEVGRTAYMQAAAVPYRDLEAEGYFMPVASFQGEVREPLHYADEFEIHTRVTRLRSRLVEFAYEIRKAERMVARGMTIHICVDSERRPATLPRTLRALLGGPAHVVR